MIMRLAALLLCAAVPAAAEDGTVTHGFSGSFEDAAFAVETVIVGRGLVIDHVSHVGEMLERTRKDVGSDVVLFEGEADIFLFCSATVSREVMEADPMNIRHCPYGVFVAQTGDGVVIGYEDYPGASMEPVKALLDGIVQEAVAF